MKPHELMDRFRTRLLSELHIGHLRPGDRLPPIRELAREFDADHRAVAGVYRKLADEGLVELRGRDGAYVAPQLRLGGELMEETARWLASMLIEARTRRITVPSLPAFIRRCTASVRLRCACIDSNADSVMAMCSELTDEFGFEAFPVWAEALTIKSGKRSVPGEVLDADLLVTTLFHSSEVRRVADLIGKPVVVVTIAQEMAGVIERHLTTSRLTVVVVDPEYGERFKRIYGAAPSSKDRIRVLLASDTDALARLDRLEPVLVSRAARRLLPDLDLPLLLSRYPSISTGSGREIVNCMIRSNLERSASD